MSTSSQRAKNVIESIEQKISIDDLVGQLCKKEAAEVSTVPSIPSYDLYSSEGRKKRISFLSENISTPVDYIAGNKMFGEPGQLKGNVENYIGMAQVPIGLAGPVRVNGTKAQGDFYVPLATTEGALVASYNRGIKVCRKSGAIHSVCLVEAVQRSPYFKFENIYLAGRFVGWMLKNIESFKLIVKEHSNNAILDDVKTNIEGNSVIITFEFRTGDAAGQNMVTVCANAICEFIVANCPDKPIAWFVESNYSGDKKATALSFTNVRGKKVTSEIILPRENVEKYLRTTPEKIELYWRTSTLAVLQSGSIGAQGHVANGLTALFISCGQDVACIAEAAVGITRMEVTSEGGLYASVTLPNLIVGTVGGGTSLPTQKECLQLMECYGPGNAKKFAEICGAVCLAGEISIAAAIAAGHFTDAHKKYGRKRN